MQLREDQTVNRPRFRLSVRTMTIMVVLSGTMIFLLRGCILHPDNTIYANGYSETGFRQLRVGMTSIEVVALIGAPLEKAPYTGGASVWDYTDQYNRTRSFWRRWLVIENDTVEEVVNDYFEE
jgi:outer membrane protein assembly factor BamE (lipoprotein component of BamABCDE complex)